jgi:hypothetical protein
VTPALRQAGRHKPMSTIGRWYECWSCVKSRPFIDRDSHLEKSSTSRPRVRDQWPSARLTGSPLASRASPFATLHAGGHRPGPFELLRPAATGKATRKASMPPALLDLARNFRARHKHVRSLLATSGRLSAWGTPNTTRLLESPRNCKHPAWCVLYGGAHSAGCYGFGSTASMTVP